MVRHQEISRIQAFASEVADVSVDAVCAPRRRRPHSPLSAAAEATGAVPPSKNFPSHAVFTRSCSNNVFSEHRSEHLSPNAALTRAVSSGGAIRTGHDLFGRALPPPPPCPWPKPSERPEQHHCSPPCSPRIVADLGTSEFMDTATSRRFGNIAGPVAKPRQLGDHPDVSSSDAFVGRQRQNAAKTPRRHEAAGKLPSPVGRQVLAQRRFPEVLPEPNQQNQPSELLSVGVHAGCPQRLHTEPCHGRSKQAFSPHRGTVVQDANVSPSSSSAFVNESTSTTKSGSYAALPACHHGHSQVTQVQERQRDSREGCVDGEVATMAGSETLTTRLVYTEKNDVEGDAHGDRADCVVSPSRRSHSRSQEEFVAGSNRGSNRSFGGTDCDMVQTSTMDNCELVSMSLVAADTASTTSEISVQVEPVSRTSPQCPQQSLRNSTADCSLVLEMSITSAQARRRSDVACSTRGFTGDSDAGLRACRSRRRFTHDCGDVLRSACSDGAEGLRQRHGKRILQSQLDRDDQAEDSFRAEESEDCPLRKDRNEVQLHTQGLCQSIKQSPTKLAQQEMVAGEHGYAVEHDLLQGDEEIDENAEEIPKIYVVAQEGAGAIDDGGPSRRRLPHSPCSAAAESACPAPASKNFLPRALLTRSLSSTTSSDCNAELLVADSSKTHADSRVQSVRSGLDPLGRALPPPPQGPYPRPSECHEHNRSSETSHERKAEMSFGNSRRLADLETAANLLRPHAATGLSIALMSASPVEQQASVQRRFPEVLPEPVSEDQRSDLISADIQGSCVKRVRSASARRRSTRTLCSSGDMVLPKAECSPASASEHCQEQSLTTLSFSSEAIPKHQRVLSQALVEDIQERQVDSPEGIAEMASPVAEVATVAELREMATHSGYAEEHCIAAERKDERAHCVATMSRRLSMEGYHQPCSRVSRSGSIGSCTSSCDPSMVQASTMHYYGLVRRSVAAAASAANLTPEDSQRIEPAFCFATQCTSQSLRDPGVEDSRELTTSVTAALPEKRSDVGGSTHQASRDSDTGARAPTTGKRFTLECHDVLRSAPSDSAEVLKQKYRQRILQSHPDRGGQHEDFIRVKESINYLVSKQQRALRLHSSCSEHSVQHSSLAFGQEQAEKSAVAVEKGLLDSDEETGNGSEKWNTGAHNQLTSGFEAPPPSDTQLPNLSGEQSGLLLRSCRSSPGSFHGGAAANEASTHGGETLNWPLPSGAQDGRDSEVPTKNRALSRSSSVRSAALGGGVDPLPTLLRSSSCRGRSFQGDAIAAEKRPEDSVCDVSVVDTQVSPSSSFNAFKISARGIDGRSSCNSLRGAAAAAAMEHRDTPTIAPPVHRHGDVLVDLMDSDFDRRSVASCSSCREPLPKLVDQVMQPMMCVRCGHAAVCLPEGRTQQFLLGEEMERLKSARSQVVKGLKQHLMGMERDCDMISRDYKLLAGVDTELGNLAERVRAVYASDREALGSQSPVGVASALEEKPLPGPSPLTDCQAMSTSTSTSRLRDSGREAIAMPPTPEHAQVLTTSACRGRSREPGFEPVVVPPAPGHVQASPPHVQVVSSELSSRTSRRRTLPACPVAAEVSEEDCGAPQVRRVPRLGAPAICR